MQDDLHWNSDLSNLQEKLNCGIGLLWKLRHCVSKYLLTTIYYSLINSHLIYAIRGQNKNHALFQRISSLLEKALPIIDFKRHETSTDPQNLKNLRFHQIQNERKQHFKNLRFHQIQKWVIC